MTVAIIISIVFIITMNLLIGIQCGLEFLAMYIAKRNIKKYGCWWGNLHGWKEEFVKKYK